MDFDELIKNEDMAKNTQKRYRGNIAIIKRALNIVEDDRISQWINKIKVFKRVLKEENGIFILNNKKYKPASIMSIMITWNAIIKRLDACGLGSMVMRSVRKEVADEQTKYNELVDGERSKNAERGVPHRISMRELRTILDLAPELEEKDFASKVAVALYILEIPPLRLDWAMMWLYFEEPKEDERPDNYLVITDDYLFFVLSDYKTEAKYGKYTSPRYDKNTEIYKILRRYTDTFGDNEQILLKWKSEKGNIVIPDSNKLGKIITEMFQKYLGKHITVNTIRRIYETELIQCDEYREMTVEEKRERHRHLLHDFSTAQKYNIIWRNESEESDG